METLYSFLKYIISTLQQGAWPDLGVWSYVLLALLVATEGPIATLIGAAAAAAGYLDITYVLMAAAIGNVTGDCFWYTVGYVNKIETLYRYGRWLGLRSHHLERLEVEMKAHAIKLILISKFTYGLIIPTLVTAGLARVPLRRWLPTVLVIESIWTVLLVTIGFKAAGTVHRFEHGLEIIGVVVLVLVLIFGFWYGPRLFRRSAQEDEPEILPTEISPIAPDESYKISGTIATSQVEKSNGKLSMTAERTLRYRLPKSVSNEMHQSASQKDAFAVVAQLATGQQKNDFCCETVVSSTPSTLVGVKTLSP